MVEVNRVGLYVGFLAICCFLRNVFVPDMWIPNYPLYPYRMNGNLIRCSNAYFSAKGKKSFPRILFFNLLRVTFHEIIKELVFKGKIILWEVAFVTACCVVYTAIFHMIPLRIFRKFRWIWGYLLMEYYTKHSADLIQNRNELERLQSHNFCAFFLFLYLESNSTLTPAIFDGLLYGDFGMFDVPLVVYDFAFNYFIAIPAHYLMQVLIMGAKLQFHWPSHVSDLWRNNRHISGYIPVNEINT